MRAYSARFSPPLTMIGEQVSKVIKSKNDSFPVGTIVLCHAGWQSHYTSTGENLRKVSFDLDPRTSLSHLIGALGMPGATAYFGLLRLMEPKEREILIVNGAAGAVGSLVGQLAKVKGCTVIGFVGSDDKVDWCKSLGFDHVFNYKKCEISEAIKSVAPEGADMFFDNVGGDYYHTIINKHLRKYARVSICGSIENYNDTEPKSCKLGMGLLCLCYF